VLLLLLRNADQERCAAVKQQHNMLYRQLAAAEAAAMDGSSNKQEWRFEVRCLKMRIANQVGGCHPVYMSHIELHIGT
jgi:hypothetical protein